MRVTPREESQLADQSLWPAGDYPFRVLNEADMYGRVSSTRDSISREKGNEMIVLVLEIRNSRGNFKIIEDYLLDGMAFKLRHAADACGLLDKYNSGLLPAKDFIGKTGKLTLRIKKDKDGRYDDKNEVADYIKTSVDMNAPLSQATPQKAPVTSLDDSEIPF